MWIVRAELLSWRSPRFFASNLLHAKYLGRSFLFSAPYHHPTQPAFTTGNVDYVDPIYSNVILISVRNIFTYIPFLDMVKYIANIYIYNI